MHANHSSSSASASASAPAASPPHAYSRPPHHSRPRYHQIFRQRARRVMHRRLRQTHARAAPARRALRVQSRGDLIRHRLHLPALPRRPSTARTPHVSPHRRPHARVEPSLDARRAKRVRVPARKPHRRAIDKPTDAARQRLVHAVDERARLRVDASDFFRRHLASPAARATFATTRRSISTSESESTSESTSTRARVPDSGRRRARRPRSRSSGVDRRK